MSWYDEWLKKSIKEEIGEMLKVDGVSTPEVNQTDIINGSYTADALPDNPEEVHDASKQVGRKAVVDDPYFDNFGQQYNYKLRMSRLSNRTLKEVSVRDWLLSSIIQCRLDTLLSFSRPEHKRLEKGFRIIKKDDKAHYTKEDNDEIAALEDFIYHCGRKEGTPPDDKMLFGEFLKKAGRDVLTFGHMAVEKVKTRGGGLHRLRLLPAESVYLINKAIPRAQIESEQNAAAKVYGVPKSDNDPRQEQEVTQVPIDYYKYVQVSYDNRPIANYGDEDMIWKLFNPQNFADSNGYTYSPVEMAIINVTTHLNVESYNSNFFTQGYAARGVLHLKGTVTPAQLANFRRQFYNSITGTQHAWRTPIVAGLDEVEWVPMSASAREMEYINFNNHCMRILCSQFAIDPIELGLDYLGSSNGRAPAQQASNEYKIAYSRERGLVPILMFFEDFMNCDVLPAIDKDLAAKYKFCFTGYTDATPQTEIAQMQAEMTVFKSMNDLLVQSQKGKIDTPAADLPLNQAFWTMVEKNMTKGEIREVFFGDKGASERNELKYFPGDPMFINWSQNILAIENAKLQRKDMASQQEAMQQEAQLKQQEADTKNKHAEAQHDRDTEKHDMEMEQMKAEASANAVKHGNPLRDSAKQFGASKASNIGGTVVANPINKLDDETK